MFILMGLVIWLILSSLFINKNHYLELLKYTLFFLIFYAVLFSDIKLNIIKGFEKLNNQYITLSTPPILKNIKVSPEEAFFYQTIYSEITKYLHKYPGTNIITNGPNALYSTFINKSENFHPLFINWSYLNVSIFPDYLPKLDNYIKTNKPLIFTNNYSLPKNYCRLDSLTNWDGNFLIAPCENLK